MRRYSARIRKPELCSGAAIIRFVYVSRLVLTLAVEMIHHRDVMREKIESFVIRQDLADKIAAYVSRDANKVPMIIYGKVNPKLQNTELTLFRVAVERRLSWLGQ